MLKEYSVAGKIYRFDIFDKITTKNEAYFIGYMAGDGAISIEKNSNRKPRMDVSSSDFDTIDFFQKRFCPDTPISSKLPSNKSRNIIARKLVYSIHFSTKFSETFKKFGILDLKINRKLVNISKVSFKYYLLGLFDADGHLSFGRRKDRNRIWMSFAITHQSYNLLHSIQTFLVNELNIASSLAKRKDENCYDLKVSSIPSVMKLIQWLYSDLNGMYYNKRKYNHYLKLISEYNSDAT